ncbi:LuxR C-terminal-related transcriptional regulator [Nonomuraea sp. NPDC052129]|uniref:helix-turn-helix domain-containing protein n=1 Tax=Nonomuraea sp. NPDC052129 TaxID=3154651 RepID=UPI0034477340
MAQSPITCTISTSLKEGRLRLEVVNDGAHDLSRDDPGGHELGRRSPDYGGGLTGPAGRPPPPRPAPAGTACRWKYPRDPGTAGRKDAPGNRLADAIRRTAAGLRALDAELVASAMEYGESPLPQLESTVLKEAARGASAEEIAARLHLSAGTVRNHLTGAITKTGARNKIDAIRIAEDAGWLL